MNTDVFERRQSRRRRSVAEHGIVSVRVRPGIDAAIVDVSAAGALIETRHRLLPGTSIDIHFATETRVPVVRGRVIRCVVARVRPDRLFYRGAILFERRVSWLPEESSRGYSVPIGKTRLLQAKWEPVTREAL
jgi:hypothetical protein